MLRLLVLAYRGETLVVVNICWYIPPDCLPNHTACPSACSRLPVQNARSRCLWKGLETPQQLCCRMSPPPPPITGQAGARAPSWFERQMQHPSEVWWWKGEGKLVLLVTQASFEQRWQLGKRTKRERVLPFTSSLSRTCRTKGKFCSTI